MPCRLGVPAEAEFGVARPLVTLEVVNTHGIHAFRLGRAMADIQTFGVVPPSCPKGGGFA